MKTMPLAATVISGALLFGMNPSFAADSLGEALTEGEGALSFRYRLEWVDQEPFSEEATASTLRTRLNYRTADWSGLSAFVEFDYVAEVFADDYNAGGGNTPSRGQYPVVADPKGDDLNQAFLQYAAGAHRFRVGRQRIIFDNARFVGNVGWRQNPQTYDAVSYAYARAGWNLTWAYVDNVNRIFGDDVAAGDHENDTHLVNLARDLGALGKLTLYHYAIDNEDAPALSNTTTGVRFAGARPAGEVKLGYALEFANQSDDGDNPVSYDADYYRVDLSADFGGATVYGGFESLEGDDSAPGRAFRTPLATLHAHNGWADKFLGTPGAGLEDVFGGVKGKAGVWSWNVLYHSFTAQSGSGDFGSEFDASLSRRFGDHYGLLLKFADFNSDSSAYRDTTKFWLQVTADF